MPHLRQNAATKDWVIFATERAARPHNAASQAGSPLTHERPDFSGECPFCPGHEESTPGETLREPADAWRVHAFPNKYPAVVRGDRQVALGDPFHHSLAAVGRHEIIVESPLHNTTLALMDEESVRLVMRAWRARYTALLQAEETEHVVLFENHGSRAGTSIEHPHSQIVSLPVAPSQVSERGHEAMRYHYNCGSCVYCDMLRAERSDQARVVVEGRCFTAFVPYAAFSQHTVWVLPHHHACCFSMTQDDELDDLAAVLRDLLARYYHGLSDPDYNLVIRSIANELVGARYYHWYVSVVPRIAFPAGFELGTGMFVNTSLPEDDARFLRGVHAGLAAPRSV